MKHKPPPSPPSPQHKPPPPSPPSPPSPTTNILLAQILDTDKLILAEISKPQPFPAEIKKVLDDSLTTQRLILAAINELLTTSKLSLAVEIESRNYLGQILELLSHNYSIRVKQTKLPTT